MPFNVFTSSFTMVNGATNASNGQIIQAPVWDSIFTDIQTGLSQCLTQFGVDAPEVALTTGTTVQIGGGSLGLRNSITGAGNITSFGSIANALHVIRFLTSGVTVTPSSSLLTPGSIALVTQAGDEAIVTSDANANYRFVGYQTALGGQASGAWNMDLRNLLSRNGSLDVWQRGAGGSASIAVGQSATAYTTDGWYATAGLNQTVGVSQQTALANGGQSCARVQRNAGGTGVVPITFGFPLDIDEARELQGKPVALSFIASTGANWSPTGGVFAVNVYTGTGNPVKQVAGTYSSQSVVLSANVTLAAGASATTFQIPTSGALCPTGTTQAEVAFSWTPTGTAGANDYIQLDDVQLEPYPTSSPFDRLPFDIQLLRSMRHYEKTFPYASVAVQAGGSLGALALLTPVAASAMSFNWQFRVPKRAAPTITTFNPNTANANARNVTGGADVAATIDTTITPSPERAYITLASVASTAQTVILHAVADAGI